MKIDHSFVMPMFWALPDFDIPIVPIFINCSPANHDVQACSSDRGDPASGDRGLHGLDVAVLGTGGLSHWVGDDDQRTGPHCRGATPCKDEHSCTSRRPGLSMSPSTAVSSITLPEEPSTRS